MTKLTYDEALQALNEDRCIDACDIKTRALRRKVWVSMNGMPGCMPNSRGLSRTKADAIESCLSIADEPRGMRADLQRTGSADFEDEVYEVYPATLAECIG